ncbi:MAG TPA: farnesyl diphosphate synthase [Afifellaceae bacterium]|nr:farnesyl diphosphate synthase [Afifellaceae bacterium]
MTQSTGSSAFAQRLADGAAALEPVLASLLDGLSGTSQTPGAPPRLLDAMRHALLGGGKRFRPFLLMETARLFGAPLDSTFIAGAAVECLHAYSLVHDDLPAMDDDALRRGRPTVHVAFDEATAILAGDALLTLAFDVLARPGTHSDPAVRSELVAVLAQAAGAGGMVGGQLLDLAGEGQPLEQAEVRRLQEMKTGALIAAACEMGTVLAGAGPEERAAVRCYGRSLGLAFQIADDLLDLQGAASEVGKATAKDAGRGKPTLVRLLGVDRARLVLDQSIAGCEAALAPFGRAAEPLVEAAHFVAERRR